MIDWSEIDTVLLDMDGTLLDLHFDNHFWLEHLPRRIARIRGQDESHARQTLQDAYTRESGTLNWYCTDYWSRQLGLDIIALKREVSHLIGYRPAAETFLKRLRENGKRVVLATNAHGKVVQFKLQHTALDRWVDRIVVSHDMGAPKEDRTFWVGLHRLEPFNTTRTLFIDDSLPVLRAAHDYGIRHLLQVLNPDSRRPPQPMSRFNGILSFEEIMPPEVS